MKKKIIVEFTLFEAETLFLVSGDSSDIDFMEENIETETERRAYHRAQQKLRNAIRAAVGFRPQKNAK